MLVPKSFGLIVVPQLYVSLATGLVLLVPALALTSPVGGPAVLYLSALIALTAMAVNAIKRYEPMNLRELSPIFIALLSPLACMFITFGTTGVMSSSELEKLTRFALALPVLWLLLRAPERWLKHVQWSILVGALAGAGILIVVTSMFDRNAVVQVGARYNAVAFANMTLLFGGMTLLSLGWGPSTRWPRLETAVKVLAVLLTVYATWRSETRSSWMMLPILGVVFLLGLRNWRRRHKVYCALAISLTLLVSAAAIWTFSSRMQQITHDVQGFATSSNRDTSFGIRLQLWHASILMFEKSPIVGIGPSKFREELRVLQGQGIVTQEVVDGFGEPHNDLLAALAGYGILGFFSILALYFVPAAVFFRRLASDDRVIRVGAQMGLLFCLSYCAFSLTEMMFRNMRSVPTYGLIMVTLIALTTARPARVRPPTSRSAA